MPNEQTRLRGHASDEAIIDAVKRLTNDYPGNTNYRVKQSTRFGRGLVHPVSFQGQNGGWYESFVFERGTTLTAYSSIGDVMRDYLARISPWIDPEFIKLLMVGLVSLILLTAIIVGVFESLNGKYLSILTGMFGTAFGYIVGKQAKGSEP